MKNYNHLPSINNNRQIRGVLSLLCATALTACTVDSTSVSDSDLIATFLVQNDNGQSNATVTFTASDNAGRNVVELVAGESVSVQRDGVTNELRKSGDGEYTASLPADAIGWYSFILVRESVERELFEREVVENYAYLPGSFQDMQAQSQQSGELINISWTADNNIPQTINGFTTESNEESFNATGTCQGLSTFDVSISEGQILQQNGMSLLEIPVAEHLRQELGLSAEEIVAVSCAFDVQLIRSINGTTDTSLDNRSSARGQVLQNVAIQWTGQ